MTTSSSVEDWKKKIDQWTSIQMTMHLTYEDSNLEQGYANWC